MIRRAHLDDEHPLPRVFTPEDLEAARTAHAGLLLACPFCAGIHQPRDGRSLGGIGPLPRLELNEPRYGMHAQTWHVHCWNCGASGAQLTSLGDAVLAWNRRAPCTSPT